MSIDLTPELETLLEERIAEKVKETVNRIREHDYQMTGKLLRNMKERFGEDVYDVTAKTYGEFACQYWKKRAEDHGDNSIESLIELLWKTLPPGFEYTMEKTDAGTQMCCTKCPNADRALRLGIEEQYYHVICKSDWSIVEGFNPNIGFTMTKNLMKGDDCCNHFYYYKDKILKNLSNCDSL